MWYFAWVLGGGLAMALLWATSAGSTVLEPRRVPGAGAGAAAPLTTPSHPEAAHDHCVRLHH